ncbi:hypothetical protein Ssi03_61500 [Sphaerisporangium siamense]|uniref:Amino acid adenylation domain-containing protein n=1 Tax=Sphaerisporangium siamense TaxID=795645 RepID=A0A7W7D8X0_9ACTN|nr:AMP-binding protein [Sphaerisporangium siamense]MBB4702463.1 amino acid adenylation domain-containing protein [Sphaerisporangium siamense]GII88160.1 hypothetical protein Ssi03_61500 [Sphaerisporangium siamense]
MTEASRARGSGTRRAVTSCAQDGLWFLHGTAPCAPAYTVGRAYRVTGELQVPALRAAWRAVVRRHESLRTTLVEESGRPVQEIAPECDPRAFADLGTAAGPDPDATAARLYARMASEPLDLAAGPLARLGVARLGAGEHLVLILLHRAVADDASMAVVVEELSACYAAATACRSAGSVRPALPPRYADHAREERARLAAPGLGERLDRWAAELTPHPSPAVPPPDRPRRVVPEYEGGAARFHWGADLAGPVRDLAEAEGVPPYAVPLAAFQALLARYGGEERVAVGVPVSTRPPGFERAVGCFENLVVVCTDLSGRPSFRDLLRRAARSAGTAFARRDVPFDRLVRALGPDREAGRVPFCDVMVAFEAPEPVPDLGGAVVRRLRVEDAYVRADLALTLGEAATGSLAYRTALYDDTTARLVLRHLRTLLAAALRDPDAPVEALPLETPERARLAVRAADRVTGAAAPDLPVHELVRLRARRAPSAPALSFDGEVVSYGELDRWAGRVAAALGAPGGVAGRPVAVRTASGPRQIAASLGVLRAGGRLVCLGTGDVGERGRMVLGDVRPAVLVLDDPDGDPLAAWYRDELGGTVLDLAVAGREPASGPPETPAPVPFRLGEAAYVTYTSGSTGRPKGIAQTHATFAQFVTWFADEFRMGPGARVAQWAAPGYDASLVEAFSALTAGATLCPVPDKIRANPDKVVEWLADQRITLFQTVPSFARQLLGLIERRGPAEPPLALDHLLLAGEPLPGELAGALRAALPGVRLVNLYGPTESILATWHEITGPVRGIAPIGGSIPGRQVLVLDDRDRPCPAGVTGQIVVIGPYVTSGYVGAAAGDRASFQPVPAIPDLALDGGHCYRTGDLGRRRWDGSLEFGGRRDFQIKFNGVRVELTDIEAALAAEESVADCAVVPVADTHGLVTRLVAYVVPRPGTGEAEPGPWRAALRRRFGRSALPVSFKIMDGLPRNAGGKVDRRGLPGPGSSPAGAAGTRQTRVEREMAALWSELLGGDPSAPDDGVRFSGDTFFSAGGHSLLVPVLLRRIRERFGTAVSLPEYHANPTFVGLSALVDAQIPSVKAASAIMMG